MATPPGVKGQVVNKAGLGRVAGVTLKTVDDWVRRGLPVLTKGTNGQQWRIDTAAAIEWIVSQRVALARAQGVTPSSAGGDLDLNEQRARESKERADKYALENAKARRELIPIEDVIDHWGKMISAAKRQLRGVPVRARSAGVLPDLSPQGAADLLRLIDEALTELAGDGVPDSNGSGREPLGEDEPALGSAA